MPRPDVGDVFRGIEAARIEKARENAESRSGAEKDLAALAAIGVAASQAESLPNPTPGSNFIRKMDPPMEFAIKPILPRGEVIEVNGGHGRLKSTLVLGWALSVASGRDWGPYGVTEGKACFVSMEDRERVIRARVQAWIVGLPSQAERQEALAKLDHNFSCLSREQAREYAITRMDRGKVVQADEVILKLKQIAKDHVLVVLETTARLHGGEEDNTGLIAFGLAVEEIATETGATIVIIRHQSKSDARSQAADSYAGRGGGALADAARGVFVITRPDVNDPRERDLRPIVLHHAKTTIGAPVAPMYWKPEAVRLPNGDVPVFLRTMTKSEVASDLELKLIERVRESFPEGILRDDLIKSMGVSDRGKARGVLDDMVKRGSVIEGTMATGKKGKPARIYRMIEWETNVDNT